MKTRVLFRLALLAVPLLGNGCTDDLSTKTKTSDLRCGPIKAGRACLVMVFSVEDDVRDEAEGSLKANLYYGVYHGGDVDLLGPGDNAAAYPGDDPIPVDFTAANATTDVVISNVGPGEYHVLGFLDTDGNAASVDAEADEGDPVTFPSAAFEVEVDKVTIVDVVLDMIRP